MDLDPKGELFYNEKCKKKQTYDLETPYHGCSGADWWFCPRWADVSNIYLNLIF